MRLSGLIFTAIAVVNNVYGFSTNPVSSIKSSSSSLSSPPTSATRLFMSDSIVEPNPKNRVGIVGRGFTSVLVAKLCALSGYSTWYICPNGEQETITKLLGSCDIEEEDTEDVIKNKELLSKLELFEAGMDSDIITERMKESSALILAVDDDTPVADAVINYLLSDELSGNLKRVVALSKNLNGKGMGFFVKASKISANSEVWDCGTKDLYEQFESTIKKKIPDGAAYTIVRGGTYKGGGCGEEGLYPQYLSQEFYEMVKKDIVSWQFLFDCKTRGVTLEKGDVMEGPWVKAVFCALSSEAEPGDSGRCALAEAMVRSLNTEKTMNVDFGIGTAESREPPTDAEWDKLFSVL